MCKRIVRKLWLVLNSLIFEGAIIGTFQEKSAQTFWDCVKRLPLEGNRIVAWKFCHVLHKVLREGHESVVPLSQKHKERIKNVGKLWVKRTMFCLLEQELFYLHSMYRNWYPLDLPGPSSRKLWKIDSAVYTAVDCKT